MEETYKNIWTVLFEEEFMFDEVTQNPIERDIEDTENDFIVQCGYSEEEARLAALSVSQHSERTLIF